MKIEDIKFRVWDEGLKRMIYFTLKEANDTVDCSIYEDVMLFTGKISKNNKDIYQGDIIDYYYVVEWDEAAATYILTNVEEKIYCMELCEKAGVEEHGITGNIFENKEST